MTTVYFTNLIEKVINCSKSKNWHTAILEWDITDDYVEDVVLSSSCICGKEKLRYLFTIKNSQNGNTLYPIGSSCIKKFERDDLNIKASIKEALFKLFHAIIDKNYIELSSEYFSKKLLKYLYEQDIFKKSTYNHFNPKEDYDFLLKMFNKRDKNSITEKEQKKINAIIITSIKPYLIEQLKTKIKNFHN